MGRWRTDPVVDLVLYDFGAASVAYHVAVDGGLEELRDASDASWRDETLGHDARERVHALLASLGAAATKPRVADFTEDYAIFGFREVPGGLDVAQFCDANAEIIAQILRADDGPLSKEEITNATELRISDGPSDVTIVDWDAAFVVDPDPEDVRAVLEFANVQLLEMRWLDLQIDDAIEQSYQVLSRRWTLRAFRPSTASSDVRAVAELQLESTVLLERVSNALKVFGEEVPGADSIASRRAASGSRSSTRPSAGSWRPSRASTRSSRTARRRGGSRRSNGSSSSSSRWKSSLACCTSVVPHIRVSG